ncbi:MAG: radical SAM protein [Synergistaceae bacterium]|nr:radical SAM protein [Synergistaceae bacterium]
MNARWYAMEGGAAKCRLCFHGCLVPEGGTGYCGARGWNGGFFASPYLGRFSSCAVDPIEKKPLYHWRAGSSIFSLGSLGCNMRCPFCQNHAIAQPANMKTPLTEIPPEELVRHVQSFGLPAVAYTYNEPALQAEYILEAAPLLKNDGIASVIVTNGMFSREALNDLLPWIDAANVDVKTFDSGKYADMGGSLDTVRENVESMTRAGVHVELTNLIVPGISDSPEDFERMTDWIASISPDIPLHISRYFPAHRCPAPPTDIGLMRGFQASARRKLKSVHLGNV